MGMVQAKEDKYAPLHTQEPCQDTSKQAREVDIKGVSARVDRINIEGLGRTKDDIVEQSVKELFKARNFQDVMAKAHKVRGRLDSLGCFKSIGIYIDTSRGPGATPEGLEVTFHVQELKRVVGGVNTMIGNNEGSLVVGLKLPNLAGRGERVQAEYSYGNQKTSNINVAFIKPFINYQKEPILTCSLFQQAADWPWSGYATVDKGTLVDLAFTSTGSLRHNLQWEGSIRELGTPSKTSAFEVRSQAGPKLKSAFRHILCLDQRDDKVFPTGGRMFQWTTEFAGPGGNVGHVKNEFHLQVNRYIQNGLVLQGSLQGGILSNLNNYEQSDLSEKYYLGGPLSLRGFTMRGAGPAAEDNFTGAPMFWAAGLQLFSPLPFRPGQGGIGDLFRVHGFFNVGNVGEFDISPDLEASWASLSEKLRMSTGLGLAMRIGHIARLELNYCFPLKYEESDSICQGIQFGIGLKFL
ncbi:sorting and assembly machinery component 50 homolog A isoform X2 [Ctenocephalides felis]|uniref:sorting and assembly machinery component 50 homolog A isoform X1 n=1 Tax=Ctenocephalides felis TaxID=7515 RepID=UPI000E6E3A3D|nr:sorting and assembly machinery component 50 homolog A isoform X1 [Ctenocephalides felis]XP_026480678.1 sorting and assembly machinery component 50 homolog A isoform X2 [Ctenocephalides felis]